MIENNIYCHLCDKPLTEENNCGGDCRDCVRSIVEAVDHWFDQLGDHFAGDTLKDYFGEKG